MALEPEESVKMDGDYETNTAISYEDSYLSDSEIFEDGIEASDADLQSENAKEKKSNMAGIVYDLIFYAMLIFICVYIVPNFVLQRTIVDGSSMADTLLNGEQLYVEKLSYRFDALDRFDIIVFYPYGRDNEEYYVKRIIGLPGETVQIIDSKIYINGEILEENYGKEPIEDPGRAAQPITLADDEYFVMGDNRNVSKDSRTEEVGNVKKENIGGRAILRILPLKRFGTID
ncbi:signal peptidase I [Variimorphobacter saccharofermentans]|nr:signal peptidase I [Variimorphobacter saccharofermentans]